jgi:hypothetical protein
MIAKTFSSQSQPKANPDDPELYTLFEDLEDGKRAMVGQNMTEAQVLAHIEKANPKGRSSD